MPPSAVRPDLPNELDWLCRDGLRPDPWRRPPRAYDVLRRLRPVLDDLARRPPRR